MFDNIERTAVFIRDCIRDIPERHKQNKDELEQIRKEELDLLHLIELTNMNASEGFKAYKELQKVLQRRRKLKDENELLTPLAETIRKFKGNLAELDKIIGDIRRIEASQGNRMYKCRVRTDLQDKF